MRFVDFLCIYAGLYETLCYCLVAFKWTHWHDTWFKPERQIWVLYQFNLAWHKARRLKKVKQLRHCTVLSIAMLNTIKPSPYVKESRWPSDFWSQGVDFLIPNSGSRIPSRGLTGSAEMDPGFHTMDSAGIPRSGFRIPSHQETTCWTKFKDFTCAFSWVAEFKALFLVR